MTRILLKILLLLIPAYSFTQNTLSGVVEEKKIIHTIGSDTTYFNYVVSPDVFDFTPITDKTEPYVFRSWGTNYLLEITQDKYFFVKGTITYYCVKVDDYKESYSLLPKEIYSQSYDLSTEHAAAIYELVKTTNINIIPSDKYIKGWRRGLDGYLYQYQVKNQNLYSYKSYWCTGNQKDIPEAAYIQAFESKLKEYIGESYEEKFHEKMPFLCWHFPGQPYSVFNVKSYYHQELNKLNRRENGRYVNVTQKQEIIEGDTTYVAISYWAGYKFIARENNDYKSRAWTEYSLTHKGDTVSNSEIFRPEKLTKLTALLNKKFRKQFNLAKADTHNEGCLDNVSYVYRSIDELEMGLSYDKELTFRMYYNVGTACLPVMHDYVSLPYKDIKRYLKEEMK